jgi:hypothetical protein
MLVDAPLEQVLEAVGLTDWRKGLAKGVRNARLNAGAGAGADRGRDGAAVLSFQRNIYKAVSEGFTLGSILIHVILTSILVVYTFTSSYASFTMMVVITTGCLFSCGIVIPLLYQRRSRLSEREERETWMDSMKQKVSVRIDDADEIVAMRQLCVGDVCCIYQLQYIPHQSRVLGFPVEEGREGESVLGDYDGERIGIAEGHYLKPGTRIVKGSVFIVIIDTKPVESNVYRPHVPRVGGSTADQLYGETYRRLHLKAHPRRLYETSWKFMHPLVIAIVGTAAYRTALAASDTHGRKSIHTVTLDALSQLM